MYEYIPPPKLSILVGLTLTNVENDGDEIIFTTDDNRRFHLYHAQNCCESVSVDDVIGDLLDLVGTPILEAEEVSNEPEPPSQNNYGSETWTFYKFATIKGRVTIRFYGTSNGYYSESVDFGQIR